MSPAAIRSHRLAELTRIVGKLSTQNKTPEEIINAVKKRALKMAAPHTAESYVQEIIRRHSK